MAFDSWHGSLSPINFVPVEILSSACKCQYILWLPFVAGLKVTSDALIGKSNWDVLFQQPNFFSKYKYIIFPCLIVFLNLASIPPSLGLNDFHHLNVYLVHAIAIKNLYFVTVVCLIICSFHTTISELMVKRQYLCSVSRCSKATGFPQQHSQNWFFAFISCELQAFRAFHNKLSCTLIWFFFKSVIFRSFSPFMTLLSKISDIVSCLSLSFIHSCNLTTQKSCE